MGRSLGEKTKKREDFAGANQDKNDFCFIATPRRFLSVSIAGLRQPVRFCHVEISVYTILPDDSQRSASGTAAGPTVIGGAR
jgi:hypothetical protein